MGEKVCIPCKRPMNCIKTGASFLYGEAWVYSGDAYRCPDCGAMIGVLAEEGQHKPEAKSNMDLTLYVMEE